MVFLALKNDSFYNRAAQLRVLDHLNLRTDNRNSQRRKCAGHDKGSSLRIALRQEE